MSFLHKEKSKRGRTGKFLTKYNKFSSDMNPAPLSKPIRYVSGEPRPEGPGGWGVGVGMMMMYLKSVDGSFPCQPISFHCSDTKPWSSSSGKAAFHNALKASFWVGRDEDEQ